MSFGERLGAVLDRKREDRGWSFAQLAVEIHGDDSQGGESRKSDTEKFCRGGTKRPQAATLFKLRKSGLVTQEEIDACRTPQELELAHFADQLFSVIADAAAQAGIDEGLTAEITDRYAEGNPGDFDAALAGLKRALEIAAKRRTATNQPTEVDDILAQVERLNTQDLTEGTKSLKAALAAQLDAEAAAGQATDQLIDAAIDQAVLERNVEDAVEYNLEKVTRTTTDPEQRCDALLAVAQDTWLANGRNKGLNFDLLVAIGLAKRLRDWAQSTDQRGAANGFLGNALQTLGERESDTSRLEQAVTAYHGALKERTRDRVPFDWAKTQNNLGTALQALGERDSDTTRLEQAVSAYRDALKEYTRDRVPLDWAATQNNLGYALATLGERESDTSRLEQAVSAYHDALKERTRDHVPLNWATTQNNLGIALQTLGEHESDTARLEQAVTAYRNALKEYTRDRVPLSWAMTHGNLCGLHLVFFDITADPTHLDTAQTALDRARDVFAEAGASHYLSITDALQSDIDQRRAAL